MRYKDLMPGDIMMPRDEENDIGDLWLVAWRNRTHIKWFNLENGDTVVTQIKEIMVHSLCVILRGDVKLDWTVTR